MPLKIRIGSRPRKVALAQATIVRDWLRAQIPEIEIEIVEIRTSGDKITSASLADVGGKGLFIKELEQALANRTIDAAVHSMKDLPALLPEQFRVAAVPGRATWNVVLAPPLSGTQDKSRTRDTAAARQRRYATCAPGGRQLRRDHS